MPGEPEVPAFVSEGAAGQRVSPYAAMPDMPMQNQQAPARRSSMRIAARRTPLWTGFRRTCVAS